MPTLRPRKPHSEAPATAGSSASRPKAKASASISTAIPASSPTPNKRTTQSAQDEKRTDEMIASDEERPLLDGSATQHDQVLPENLSWAQRNQWIVFALASGACAAFNGVFAKLTTTELTTKFSMAIARMLGLENVENVIELIVRGSFFGLNLVFNGVMWTLFTTALARGNSTTQVSIMNTSSNFVITAILGFAIFSEALPPLWWLGAAMLVAGNVVIGRKDEAKQEGEGGEEVGSEAAPVLPSGKREGMGPSRPRVGGQVDGVSGEGENDEDVADLRK